MNKDVRRQDEYYWIQLNDDKEHWWMAYYNGHCWIVYADFIRRFLDKKAEKEFKNIVGPIEKPLKDDLLKQKINNLQKELDLANLLLQEALNTMPSGSPDADAIEINRLRKEIDITDKLLEDQYRVIDAIPECKVHGERCIPSAVEWIKHKSKSVPDKPSPPPPPPPHPSNIIYNSVPEFKNIVGRPIDRPVGDEARDIELVNGAIYKGNRGIFALVCISGKWGMLHISRHVKKGMSCPGFQYNVAGDFLFNKEALISRWGANSWTMLDGRLRIEKIDSMGLVEYTSGALERMKGAIKLI